MLSRYSLTHVVVIECGPVKTICSTGFLFKFSARKAMKKLSKSIKAKSGENLYHTSEKFNEGVVELVMHDTKHYITIQEL